MPHPTPKLVINELYPCLQGESTYSGRPCVLVRLTGCHLRCSWCDSEYSFYEGERMPLESILEQVRSFGLPLVLVTGGEPLLQKHTPLLLQRLADEDYEVLLETSGNLPWHNIDPRVTAIVDVKCPGSGQSHKNRLELLEHLRPRDEVKFVVAGREDYDYTRDVILQYDLGRRNNTHISPVWGAVPFEDLARWVLEDRLPARLQVQLHKIIYGPTAREV